MNLFFLDIDPKKCAKFHCSKHVVKMILELVQMMYTAHNVLKTENIPLNGYRSFSPQHPTCIWIRQCAANYNYCATLAKCLCEEYTYRYNRIHKCEEHVNWLIANVPTNFVKTVYRDSVVLSYNAEIEALGCTPVPLAMPDNVKYPDTFKSYRMYYIVHKRGFARWTNRPQPWWYTSGDVTTFMEF
jgi:hypothetical protein